MSKHPASYFEVCVVGSQDYLFPMSTPWATFILPWRREYDYFHSSFMEFVCGRIRHIYALNNARLTSLPITVCFEGGMPLWQYSSLTSVTSGCKNLQLDVLIALCFFDSAFCSQILRQMSVPCVHSYLYLCLWHVAIVCLPPQGNC